MMFSRIEYCRCILVLSVLLLSASADAQTAKDGTKYKPIEDPPAGYEHDRWQTEPSDHVFKFKAFVTSFDGADDSDGDGDTEDDDKWGIPEYLDFLEEVEAVQEEQYQLLKRLVQAGHTTVYRESLTPEMEQVIATTSRVLWKLRKQQADSLEPLLTTPNVLSLGTPCRLLAEGHLKRVRAIDSDESLAWAYPFAADGSLREVSDDAIEKREDYMVRQMLQAPKTAIVVLGGGHDLADNIRRLGKGQVGLIVVTTKRYQVAAGHAGSLPARKDERKQKSM